MDVGLQSPIATRLANNRRQNLAVGVNNLVTTPLIEQNKSHNVDPFEWVRKFLLEDS